MKILYFFIVLIFLSVIFFFQIRLINQPVQDNDEGIYLTTFLLIDHGLPAYKETFMSQPPGFLLSVYPEFSILGKTLQAARLTIGVWSLAGLLSIIWICIELKNKWAGVLAFGILYLIPYYFNQTLIFQSDALVVTFSLISLASFFRFLNTKHLKWLVVTAVFLNLSFWTKFNFFLILPIIIALLILLRNKQLNRRNIINLSIIFIAISILFYIFLIAPFGIKEIINNTVELRLAAKDLQAPFFPFLTQITKDSLFLLLFIVSAVFLIFKKDRFHIYYLLLIIWVSVVFTFFLFYRPFYPHHMIILVVPVVLLFSLSVTSWLKKITTFYPYIISFVLFLSLINYSIISFKKPVGILNTDQKKAVEIIDQNTKPEDIVVTDEEILNGATKRLPPPELSDVSYVRILSGNLSAEKFKEIIEKSRPKLIIPWNGRLQSIEGFENVLGKYRPLTLINNKIIYIRK